MNAKTIELVPAGPKQSWDAEVNGRKFNVSKSSFGWHIGEYLPAPAHFKNHVFGTLVYANKAEVLKAIADNA